MRRMTIKTRGEPRHRLCNSDFQQLRRRRRNNELRRQLRAFYETHTCTKFLGTNTTVERYLEQVGFSAVDLAIADIEIKGDRMTVVCIPAGLWKSEEALAKLLHLDKLMASGGYQRLVVHQHTIKQCKFVLTQGRPEARVG